MNRIKITAFGRITVATALAMGLSVGTVGIASAANHPTKPSAATTTHKFVNFQGVVSASSVLPMSATSGSLVVTNAKNTMMTFVFDSSTKVLPSASAKNAVALAIGERVEIHALAGTTLVAKRVVILAAKAKRVVAVQGIVSDLTVIGTAYSFLVTPAKGAAVTFTFDTATMVLRPSNLKNPAALANGDRVEVIALAATPTFASRINILGTKK